MRALTRTFRHGTSRIFGSAFLPLILAIVCVAPLCASATAGLSGQQVSQQQDSVLRAEVPDTPARPSGALGFKLLALGSVFGAGIVVRLSAKRHAADGTVTPERFNLDSDADNYADQIEAFGEAKLDEGAAPLRAQLTTTAADRDAYRDMAIDEVVRVRQAEHAQLAAAGQTEGDFDAEGERAFLESLTPDRLKLHFTRARQTTVSLKPQTSGEQPTDEAADKAYGSVTVA